MLAATMFASCFNYSTKTANSKLIISLRKPPNDFINRSVMVRSISLVFRAQVLPSKDFLFLLFFLFHRFQFTTTCPPEGRAEITDGFDKLALKVSAFKRIHCFVVEG